MRRLIHENNPEDLDFLVLLGNFLGNQLNEKTRQNLFEEILSDGLPFTALAIAQTQGFSD